MYRVYCRSIDRATEGCQSGMHMCKQTEREAASPSEFKNQQSDWIETDKRISKQIGTD